MKIYRTSLKCLAAALILAAWMLAPLCRTAAQVSVSAPYVVRVEEDWTVTVNSPSPDIAAPQISSQMSGNPAGDHFFQFHLNYQDVLNYASGGLQLEAWDDAKCKAVTTSVNKSIMATPNELVTWTQ